VISHSRVAGRLPCESSRPGHGIRRGAEHESRVARQGPALARIELGGAAAPVADRLAGPEEAPAGTDGRREQGLGDRWKGEVAAEIEGEEPIVGIGAHAEEPEHQRLGPDDGAIHPARALRPKDRVIPAQSQEVDVQGVGGGMALALGEIELRAIERETVGRVGQGRLGIGPGQARELR
jgi:hypothetical protein